MTTAAHKEAEFIYQLNTTFGSGGLVCSFNDNELTQYIIWKRKMFHSQDMLAKEGILRLGMQPCGKMWAFSDKIFIHEHGLITTTHQYAWLAMGARALAASQKEITLDDITCDIKEPLSTSSFKDLLVKLKLCLKHNFLSCILLMGGGAMNFHYKLLQQIFGSCPQVRKQSYINKHMYGRAYTKYTT